MSRILNIQFLLWLSVAMLVYTYFGYFLLIRLLGKLFPNETKPGRINHPLPTVTVVLAAFNEEPRIDFRLQNLLQSNYPSEQLEIVVVSDASTDRTADIASALADQRVHVIVQEKRSGKAACLNTGVAAASNEIIVFADVRQRFTAETILQLVQHFNDPKVGAVSGSLEIDSSESAVGGGVDAYWKLEKSIRYWESMFDSSIGCTGAVYAIRRNLYRPLPPDTLLDDVVTPMQIAAQGFRVIFEPLASAFDPQSLEPTREWIRKQRTLAGNYQMLFRHPKWLLPWCNRLWWQLLSHKYLRLAAPWFMILVLALNCLLLDRPFYHLLFSSQCAFYVLAAVGGVIRGKKTILFSLPAGFLFLNLTAIHALWYYLRQSGQPGWKTVHVKTDQTKYV